MICPGCQKIDCFAHVEEFLNAEGRVTKCLCSDPYARHGKLRPRINAFAKGQSFIVSPGDHFNLILPDGTILNVEQTADDFSIVRDNGLVAYTKPTSEIAKRDEDTTQTTGRN